MRANGAAELPCEGAKFLRVGGEDEAGERGLVDKRVRRRRRAEPAAVRALVEVWRCGRERDRKKLP